jgi:hypothetical protein
MTDYADLFKQRMNILAGELGEGSPARLAAELRLPERNVTRYCSGQSQPRFPEAIKLAQRAGVSLDWLAGLSDERDAQALGPGAPQPGDEPPDTRTAPRPRRPRGAA